VRSSGTAHLTGSVSGPEGPVPGATVRVDHLVRGAGPIDVVTGEDGRWDLPNIAGGRYRVRAFLPPTLAQVEPQIFFLEDGTQQNFDLTMDSFTTLGVTAAFSPDPPTLNKPFTFVVRVARRSVDGDGVVHGEPIPNASVTLTGTQGFAANGQGTSATDANGDATFSLQCKSAGATQIQVGVRVLPTDAPQISTLQVSACVDPATTSTTAPASGPPSSSSSSSSGSSSSAPN
jgi:hypothetical protein